MSPGMDIHPFSLCQRWKLYTQLNMQLPITCMIIAPQRPGWVQLIELKAFTSLASLSHSMLWSPQEWIPCMDEMLAVCWGSSNLGLMQVDQDLLQTLIYLLKLCFPLSEQRATASNPWERGTFWRGKLKDYKPSNFCYNLFPKMRFRSCTAQ